MHLDHLQTDTPAVRRPADRRDGLGIGAVQVAQLFACPLDDPARIARRRSTARLMVVALRLRLGLGLGLGLGLALIVRFFFVGLGCRTRLLALQGRLVFLVAVVAPPRATSAKTATGVTRQVLAGQP